MGIILRKSKATFYDSFLSPNESQDVHGVRATLLKIVQLMAYQVHYHKILLSSLNHSC